MGGSSLAPEVLRRAFGAAGRAPPPARARLDRRRRPSPRSRPRVEPLADALHRLLEVRRDDRAAVPVRPFPLAHRATARNFAAITDPGSGLAELATEQGFRRHLLRRPRHRRALQRPVGLRHRPRDADGRRRAPRCSTARSDSLGDAAASSPARAPPGPERLARRGAGALASAGRDKLTFVIADSPPRPRPVARAARRRVDRQARHRHPPRRRGAARRPRGIRR